MPALFVDLDNTLSDRAASLRRWARDWVHDRFGESDPGLEAEIVRADGDGLRNKTDVAADLAELLGLSTDEQATIIATLRAGTLDRLQPTPGIVEALDAARAAGWSPFIVTNGKTSQQQAKVAKLGLNEHVDGMVVSEEVGVEKPDPRIFQIAAHKGGYDLSTAWMIGDSAHADIDGAHRAGIKSVWLRRNRPYPVGIIRPTLIADSFAEAVGMVLAS